MLGWVLISLVCLDSLLQGTVFFSSRAGSRLVALYPRPVSVLDLQDSLVVMKVQGGLWELHVPVQVLDGLSCIIHTSGSTQALLQTFGAPPECSFPAVWCSTSDLKLLIVLGRLNLLCLGRDWTWKIICAKEPRLATGNRSHGLDWKCVLTFCHSYGLKQ